MLKENGRQKPAENPEVANITGKLFKCNMCDATERFSNVQFGAHLVCTQCGGEMEEVIKTL